MPWTIRKDGNKFAIIKKDTGQVVGRSVSRPLAIASVRARYANTPEARTAKVCPMCGK